MGQTTCGNQNVEVICVNGKPQIDFSGEGDTALLIPPGASIIDADGEELYVNDTGETRKRYVRIP